VLLALAVGSEWVLVLVVSFRLSLVSVSAPTSHQPQSTTRPLTTRPLPSHIFHIPKAPLYPPTLPFPILYLFLPFVSFSSLSPYSHFPLSSPPLPPSFPFALSHPHAHLSLVRRLSYPGDYVPVHFPSQLSARLPMSSSSNGASGVSTPPSASSANANGLRSPPKITSMASKSLADSQRKQSSSPMDQTQRYVSHFVYYCPHPFYRPLFHCFPSQFTLIIVCSWCLSSRLSALPVNQPRLAPLGLPTLLRHHPIYIIHFTLLKASFTYPCIFRKSSVPNAWTKGSTNPVTQRPVGVVTANGVTNSSNKASSAQKGAPNSSKDSSTPNRNANDRFTFLFQNLKVRCLPCIKIYHLLTHVY
jgi:hypothetical protein